MPSAFRGALVFGPIRNRSPRNSGSESSVTGAHTSGAKACIMTLSSSSPCQRDTTSVASALPMVLVTARESSNGDIRKRYVYARRCIADAARAFPEAS
jgi:hypothetical protein